MLHEIRTCVSARATITAFDIVRTIVLEMTFLATEVRLRDNHFQLVERSEKSIFVLSSLIRLSTFSFAVLVA